MILSYAFNASPVLLPLIFNGQRYAGVQEKADDHSTCFYSFLMGINCHLKKKSQNSLKTLTDLCSFDGGRHIYIGKIVLSKDPRFLRTVTVNWMESIVVQNLQRQ